MTRGRMVAAVLVLAVAGCGDDGEEGTTERVVDVLASDDETLLAIGHQEEFVADVIPTTSTLWHSDDGERW